MGQLSSAARLLIAYFVTVCARAEKRGEDDVLQSAVADDPSLRPFVFRTAVEKLIAVGLPRRTVEEQSGGTQKRLLSITAEVYRQWLQTQDALLPPAGGGADLGVGRGPPASRSERVCPAWQAGETE